MKINPFSFSNLNPILFLQDKIKFLFTFELYYVPVKASISQKSASISFILILNGSVKHLFLFESRLCCKYAMCYRYRRYLSKCNTCSTLFPATNAASCLGQKKTVAMIECVKTVVEWPVNYLFLLFRVSYPPWKTRFSRGVSRRRPWGRCRNISRSVSYPTSVSF